MSGADELSDPGVGGPDGAVLDAVLRELAPGALQERGTLVDSVMERIGSTSEQQPRRTLQTPRPWRRVAVSMAAVVLVSVGVLWTLAGGGTPTAQATLDRMIAVAGQRADRTYTVVADRGNALLGPQRMEQRLTFGGGRRMVIERGLPLRPRIVAGSDGEGAWITGPVGGILRAPSFAELPLTLSLPMDDLHLEDLLRRAGDGYELEQTALAGGGARVVGLRVDPQAAASRIVAESRRDGLLTRLEIEFDRGPPGLTRLTFELEADMQRPDGFYTPEFHRRGG